MFVNKNITYAAKAVKDLTVVVRVQDDDEAGINLVDPTSVLNLVEGETAGKTFTVANLKTKPLHDVTLKVTSSQPLVEICVEPSEEMAGELSTILPVLYVHKTVPSDVLTACN